MFLDDLPLHLRVLSATPGLVYAVTIALATVLVVRVLAAREMTLTELASRVGITLANLSILKNGRARAVRFSTLAAICRELGCQPGDVLTYADEPDHSPPEGRR
ncbi:transcriptional regulator [Xylanimonas protaetiae]|uniref:Transcriptional regulator n=2 Tax=Xylanimonas protaetiae TaxID=2509457 RepID=A0A4P6F7G0_9MICO|nr:transcriptional regulator [Xylanimonas protaetiae]